MEEEKLEQAVVVVPKDRTGKPGRPTKAEMQAVKDRTKNKVGRPKGDSARIQEFKERLLATGGTKIIDKMVQIALTDGHPGQMAAVKLALDRLLPISLFEQSKAAGGVPTISINISSLGAPQPVIETTEDVTDVSFKEE